MYCPSCSKTFGATQSKCPECQTWLRTTAPKASQRQTEAVTPATASGQTSAGWSPPPMEASGNWGGSDWGGSWGQTSESGQEAGSSGGAASDEQTGGWLGQSQESWTGGSQAVGPSFAETAKTDPAPQDGWSVAQSGQDEVWNEAPQPGRGWLGDGPESEGDSVQTPLYDDSDDWVDDQAWNEEELDEYGGEPLAGTPEQHPQGASSFFRLLLVAGALFVLVLAMYGGTPKEAEDDEAARIAQEIAAYLEQGRRYVDSAKQSIDNGDYENAAAQLRFAVVDLDKGQASSEELDAAFVLLAEATFKDGDYMVSRDLWFQLAENLPELEERAMTMVMRADQALRREGRHHVQAAQKALASNRTNAAIRQARAALELFEDFGGDYAQLGEAEGTLGKAYLADGVEPTAMVHLQRASLYLPDSEYARLFRTLSKTSRPVAPAEPLVNSRPTVHQPSIVPVDTSGVPQANTTYRPRPSQPSSTTQPNSPGFVQPPAPTTMREIPPYQPKKVDRGKRQRGNDNQFVNYEDRSGTVR